MSRASSAALAFALVLAAGAGAAFSSTGRPVHSLLEARHRNVVMQEWDSSCGAAALATLLKFQLGDPVTERAVALGMLRAIDPDRVRTRGGFSLLDMKRYAGGRGYAADGYAGLTAGQLMRLAPAIVPIRSHSGDHFVVFRGVVRGQAVLADPAFGNHSMPYPVFESRWKDRLAFVVKARAREANRLHATRRDVLRVEDEAALQAAEEKLPRPLTDAQLSFAFAIDAPGVPPLALVPVTSPDNPTRRGPSPASGVVAAPAPGASAGPTPPPTQAVASVPSFPPAAIPGVSTPVIGISPTPSPSSTTTIAAPVLPPISVTAPALPPVSVTVPLPLPGITITAPSLTLPPGR